MKLKNKVRYDNTMLTDFIITLLLARVLRNDILLPAQFIFFWPDANFPFWYRAKTPTFSVGMWELERFRSKQSKAKVMCNY